LTFFKIYDIIKEKGVNMNNNYFNEMKNKFWYETITGELEKTFNIKNWASNLYKQIQDDVIAMAAFVTVLNHKCWFWYEKGYEDISKIYSDLYYKYNDLEWDWLEAHGTSEEKSWYFKTLD
jgi:hypothetical protein